MTVTEDDLLAIIAAEAIVDRAILERGATLNELGIASLDVISVMFEIENRYGLVVEESELPLTANLGDVLDFLLARLNASASENA